ncbi:MAG: tetratricopeptide repeat protein [Actinomycetota bacterium]
MFFPKLRRNAKWVFLLLAVVFGLGFVGFGVGAGGVGIGDVFRGASGSGVPSIDDAEERVSENPRDAEAFRDLATAHQTEGNTDDAIEALESFVALKPKNAAGLVDLASLYLIKVEEAQRRAQIANVRAAYLAPGASISSIAQFGDRPLDADAISSAVSNQLSQIVQTELGVAQQAAALAVDAYKRRAASEPRNALYQLELAQTAESASDIATAVAAYEKFLDLEPDDPNAVDVKRRLKELRAQSGTTG